MNNSEIKSFLKLRMYVGISAMLLPLLIILISGIQSSISYSYYTKSFSVFIGILYSIGLFLFCDNGYNLFDSILNKIVGFCMVVGIPNFGCNGKLSIVHYISSAIAFIVIGLISLFIFTKEGKYRYVYYFCGMSILILAMFIFLLLIFGYNIFWEETMIIELFGFSWLIKSKSL